MLHRSYSLLSFLRRNVNGCWKEQFYLYQIGLAKRHTSTFIKQKFIRVISNSSKLCHNKHADTRWMCATSRLASNDAKSKSVVVEKASEVKAEPKADTPIIHRIVELNEENLGKLKERALNVEAATPLTGKKEKEVKVIKKEKTKKEEKKVAAEEAAAKKRKFWHFFNFKLFDINVFYVIETFALYSPT